MKVQPGTVLHSIMIICLARILGDFIHFGYINFGVLEILREDIGCLITEVFSHPLVRGVKFIASYV